MLKQRALVQVLGQVNSGGIEGSLLFNKEGVLLAYSGNVDANTNPSVFSALVGSVWESYEKKGRDELKETIVVCEEGVLACTRVANMLVALKADTTVPLGMLRAKLHALVTYLDGPLTSVSLNS